MEHFFSDVFPINIAPAMSISVSVSAVSGWPGQPADARRSLDFAKSPRSSFVSLLTLSTLHISLSNLDIYQARPFQYISCSFLRVNKSRKVEVRAIACFWFEKLTLFLIRLMEELPLSEALVLILYRGEG